MLAWFKSSIEKTQRRKRQIKLLCKETVIRPSKHKGSYDTGLHEWYGEDGEGTITQEQTQL